MYITYACMSVYIYMCVCVCVCVCVLTHAPFGNTLVHTSLGVEERRAASAPEGFVF